MLRWPGHTQAGQVSGEPICGVDWLPTVCEVAGIAPPSDRAIDGTSLLPLLDGSGADRVINRRTPLYWHFNAAQGKPKVAMRTGDWKLLAHLSGPDVLPRGSIKEEVQQALKTAELSTMELYNLRRDIGETDDRSSREPERLRGMALALGTLYHEVRDESPLWPAWEFARYESGRIEWPPYRKPRR